MIVTKTEGDVLLELAGTPALAKLAQIVMQLPSEQRQAVAHGLQIGVAMDEYAEEHKRSDLLIRPVAGADQQRGAIVMGEVVEVGRAMFPSADHDVLAVHAGLDTMGVAGFFAAGEIGPVAGRNHLHGFTASILVFGAGDA
jgi:small ligand-binding sensory domain FIST